VAGALAGYRVLDLADEKAMLCTKLLADMGAAVTRIEKPGAVYPLTPPEYACLNAGKRRINLDLEEGEGQGTFKELVKEADALVETDKPGHLAALGLGYDGLSKINPRLVMASITGFGQDGPYRDYQSCDLAAAALGGWLSVCGEPDAPLRPYGSQTYGTASLFAANGILLALRQRHADGRGQYLDISVMECVAASLDHVLPRYFAEGAVAERRGSLQWNGAFRVFPCRDGFILLSLFRHWETLVEWLASEGMAADLADEKWRDAAARLAGLDHVIAVLEKWTLSHTAAELVEPGQLMHFPWAEVAPVPGIPRRAGPGKYLT
jgi:crotonobetainyl-CoA:carnitine CoA-transferase CaiB-like acyl-CoA transferase